MKQELLRINQLTVNYPLLTGLFKRISGYKKAVQNANFSLYRGDIIGLVGESGSGKSTLARAVTGLVPISEGQIFYENNPIQFTSSAKILEFRKSVQIVFQDPLASLNPRKTIGEAIGEALLYHNLVSSKEEMDHNVSEILEKIGLEKLAMRRYPHQFSGGQQQRICIGRALALKPKLLILDEALASLDVSIQAQILALLLKLKEEFNLSFLFISHDLSIVRCFCQSILVMNKGEIVENSDVETLFNHPSHPYTKKLLAASPISHPKFRKF